MKSLQDRFREFRRTKPVTSAATNQDIKIEFSFQRARGKPAKKPRLDTVPEGEDATSFNRHNRLLQLEF